MARARSIFKITLLVGLIVLVGGVVVRGETTGSTFATGSGTGGLELKVDNTTYYNGILQPKLSWELKHLRPWKDKFFWFKDVKPGDTGTTTVSIHITKNPAWVCLDFQNLHDKENGKNEPESHEDGNDGGELSKELEFFSWFDDGDGVFEMGEKPLFGTSSQSARDVLKGKSYAIADSKNGPAQTPNQTKYIGINWCAGDLLVNVATADITCDAEAMGNEVQTVSMVLDVSLRAVSSKQQPKFVCVKNEAGEHHGGPKGEYDDGDEEDDNYHDDDDDTTWHQGGPKHVAWNKTKNYCINFWRKVKEYKHHS